MDARTSGNFTEGSIASNILRLGIPMTVAQLTTVCYNVADRVFIGHIPVDGELALTGIGLVMPVVSIITAFANLCGMGGSPLCAMARGDGDDYRAARIMGTACTMLLAAGVLLTGFLYRFYRPILEAFGASPDTMRYASEYLRIYLLGTVFVMITLGLNPFISAQGRAKTGMGTVLIGTGVNLILDPILIYAADMGVSGAALATVISQFVSAVWVVRFLCGAPLRLESWALRPDWGLVRQIAGLGLSSFTFGLTNSVVQALGNRVLFMNGVMRGGSSAGDLYVGAMTIINSVKEVVFQPIQGITHGAQPVISYNYGARQYGRVCQAILFLTKVCLLYNAAVWLLIMLVPKAFVMCFNDSAELVEATVPAMRIYFAGHVLISFHMVGQNTFVALGRSRQAVFFSLFRKVFLVVPCVLLLPRLWGLGTNGVFLAEPICDVCSGVLCWTTMMLTQYKPLKAAQDRCGKSGVPERCH